MMRIAFCAWVVAAWVSAAPGASPQRHNRVVVVPAPSAVTIDGKLDEWDTSGAVLCAYDEAMRPRFTVRLALMYDANALYVGAHFVDETPMLNRHSPAVEPDRGWAGDCLQLRLCSDPKAPWPLAASKSPRICHLTWWYYTDQKLPVLHMLFGADLHGQKLWTGPASGAAFARDADSKGYTLEAAVGWDRLNAAVGPPRAGDVTAFVAQPLFSDATGWKQAVTFNDVIRKPGFSFQDPAMWGQAVFSPHGHLAAADRPAAGDERLRPLRLTLPRLDEQGTSLSAALYDSAGLLVRSLPVVGAAEGAGRLPESLDWDGLDDDGRPLPAGTYSLKALTHRGIGQRYVLSLHNAGTPPWRTDDERGAWGGDHGPPVAAAADAKRVYLGWTISEAGKAVIAVEPALRSRDAAQKIWGQDQVLDIGILVQALATDGQRVFVAQDGRKWGQKEGGPATAGVVMWDAETGRPINFPFGRRTLLVREWDPQGKEALNLRGLAVAGDTLYVSLYHEGKVLAYNWKTGKQTREIELPRPKGLETGEGGSLYVVSDRQIVRLAGEGAPKPVVTAGLDDPQDLAIAGGRLYVTDRGSAMCVKVFEGARQVGTIGKPGGRPAVGRYDPLGMYNPAGITIGPAGNVWVAEDDSTPKRVSVWSADGKLAGDLLGPGAYAVEGVADPARPTWINTHQTLFEIDYDKGTSKTLATLVRGESGQITAGGGFMGRALLFRHAGGRDFLVWRGHHLLILYRLGKDLIARPTAATGWLKDSQLYGLKPEHLPEKVRKDAWVRRHDYGFRWADLNGDTKIQSDEMTVEKMAAAPWGSYWGSWVDEDLTIWSSNREGKAVWRIPVVKWLPGGVPLYPSPAEQKPLWTLAETANIHYVLPGAGCVYVLEDLAGKGGAISSCSPEGRRLWSYRRVWTGFGLDSPLSQPGDVCGAMRFVGKVTLDDGSELLAVNGYFGQFNILTGQGLWLASLCHDNRYGPKADETIVWPENFSGYLYRNRDDGKVYLIAGDTDTRLWEVTGLEHIRTATATVTIAPDDRAKALAAALRRRGVSAARPPIRLRAAGAIAVDGKLDDWDLSAAAVIEPGGGRKARAALAWDEAHLYVAFDVTDDSPMANGGGDYALLFKTGDCCDVMLAADPKAPPQRRRPAGGDLRLLLSVMKDQPVAVLYEAVARAGQREPRVFSSPTGVELFDRVTVLKDAKVALVRSGQGYQLEAAIPLATLGLAPEGGTFLRGDVGVIFSDRGGSWNALRAYYANRETAIVNDIPTESRLQPANWGAVQVDKREGR